jgi:hypothetical protein
MRQFIGSIAIIIILFVCSIADFNFNNKPDVKETGDGWTAAQYGCLEYELPEYVLSGSDGACYAAALLMQRELEETGADCLYITNSGFIPTSKNPVTKQWVEILVKGEGKP